MTPEGDIKRKFKRSWKAYNPARFDGPTTLIHDTVLKPVAPKQEAP